VEQQTGVAEKRILFGYDCGGTLVAKQECLQGLLET
jgi:hypothetical protein